MKTSYISYVLLLKLKCVFVIRACKRISLKCRVCNEQDESLKHFFKRESYISHLRIDKQSTFMWIYEEDVEKFNKSILIIEQIIKIRDELINKQTNENHINR